MQNAVINPAVVDDVVAPNRFVKTGSAYVVIMRHLAEMNAVKKMKPALLKMDVSHVLTVPYPAETNAVHL